MGDFSTRSSVMVLLLIIVFSGGAYYVGLSTNSSEGKRSDQLVQELRSTIEKLQNQNQELRKRLSEKTKQLKKHEAETQELIGNLRDKLEQSRSSVQSKNDIVTVSIPNRIMFDEASAELSEKNLKVLRKVSRTLKKYPEREIRVQGHADTKPMDPDAEFESNWELSAKRAVNVLKYLVYAQNIDRTRIGAVAFGQFRPLTKMTSEKQQAKNRRVEIVLYPDTIVE